MAKLLFLGIDALDCLLLEQFAADLPNLMQLQSSGRSLKVRSTFPPDSDTAWTTILTGLNPAQHGIVRFVDPMEKSYQLLNIGTPNDALRGRTFWDTLDKAGYTTHAVFPHLCYPGWQTSGIMVTRGGSKVPDVVAHPPELLQDYPDHDALLGVRGFPDRTIPAMTSYVERLNALAMADAEFALRLMAKHEWDVFFAYWPTIDLVGHYFWNYFDRDDPNYKPGHPLEQVVLNTYKLYDQIVGRFLKQIDDDVTVVLLSDHGHGARPFKLVSVNEILRRGGFLNARNMRTNPHLSLIEKSKRTAIKAISRYGLGKLAARVMRRYPRAVQIFTRPSSVNWGKTIAYASDMSGIKSYTYGGIIINRDALDGRDYEAVRREIIDLMKRECRLSNGEPLLQFISAREEVYAGESINKYPDIVLEFKYGYGVGWAVNAPLFTQAASYNLVPGSHRGETGTCIIRSSREVVADEIDLLDVTPTILELMNVAPQFAYTGKSILQSERDQGTESQTGVTAPTSQMRA